LVVPSSSVANEVAKAVRALHVLSRRKHDKSSLYGVTSSLRVVPPSCQSDPPFLALL
jgi:hypothetical protein